MVWPFRKKLSDQDRYNKAVNAIATGFFKSSEICTKNLLLAWKNIGLDLNLDPQRQWGIARETSWYLIGKMEYSLKFELRAPNIDITIGNLCNKTLHRHIDEFGKNTTNVETYHWLGDSQDDAMQAYRTPVSLESQLPTPGSIAELEGSPLHTLMRRIEWVIKWDMTGSDGRGWKVTEELREHYETYLKRISSTDRSVQIDTLMSEHPDWKQLVTVWIGGSGMATRDLINEYDLVRLMEFAESMPSYTSLKLN